MRSSGWSNLNEIHSERPQAKITLHRVVKRDERRDQKALLSVHLLLNEIAGDSFFPFVMLRVGLILCISSGRYVLFDEDFNVEKHKEISLMDISGLNVDLALHDVMEIYICTFILSYII